MADKGTIAHPHERRVPISGGRAKAVVRPWTMAQRASIKPRLQIIATSFTALLDCPRDQLIVKLFEEFEPELLDIARETVILPEGVVWDDLDYEDGINLVQAIWETSVARVDGGGVLGKLLGLAQVGQLAARGLAGGPSPTKKPDGLMPSASPSSQDAGERPRSSSATR